MLRRAGKMTWRWGLGLAAAAVVSELAHHRASCAGRRALPAGGSRGIVVLGFPCAADGSVRPIQRWRVDIALRTLGTPRASDRVVFTGAPQRASVTEAAAMAAYASARGLPADLAAIEDRSHSTWENVANALPMVEHLDTIAFASDPLHAARARRYAQRQRPDLMARVTSADDYRPGEHAWLKIATAAYELGMAVRGRVARNPQFATRPE